MKKQILLILLVSQGFVFFSCNRITTNKNARIIPADFNFMEMMQPVPETSKLEHEGWFTWGASVQEGDDGKYHMIYCRWPKDYPFGTGWLIDAELCYAVADQPEGPFSYVSTILQGRKAESDFHAWDGASVYNPHLKKFNGKYYLYYTGTYDPYNKGKSTDREVLVRHQRIGVIEFDSVEDLVNGKFHRSDKPLLSPLSSFGYNVPEKEQFGDENNPSVANIVVVNPSVEKRPDGKYILVFKSWQNKKNFSPIHGVAIADSPTGPFKVNPDPILIVKKEDGSIAMAEDPFIWYNKPRNSFFALVRDFKGDITGYGHSMALFRSNDGINWQTAENVLASDLNIKWENGMIDQVARLERPQLLLDIDGEPLVLYCACAIEPPTDEKTNTFNIQIPLKLKKNE